MLDIPIGDELNFLMFLNEEIPKPWIVTMKSEGTQFTHTVIVDNIIDDIVYIRDPWGLNGHGQKLGTEAKYNLNDFVSD